MVFANSPYDSKSMASLAGSVIVGIPLALSMAELRAVVKLSRAGGIF